jgi:hypothetical protein
MGWPINIIGIDPATSTGKVSPGRNEAPARA